jgi:hypothetical protein
MDKRFKFEEALLPFVEGACVGVELYELEALRG